MKAARWHARRDVRIEEVPEPTPGPGQVKVRVDWCGICGTDLHEYIEGPMFTAATPHPLTGVGAPVIIGHEFAGEIVETGAGVSGWQPGDRVAMEGYWVCGACAWCQKAAYNRCDNLAFHGFSAPGGLAAYVCAPTYQLYRVDERVGRDAAALIEPVAVAVRAVQRARVELGQRALVVGAGPIGLSVLQVLRAAGVDWVAVAEPARLRREMAAAFGATMTVDPKDHDVAAAVRDACGGVDVAFECAGTNAAFQATMRSTRKGACICIVSQTNAPMELYVNELGFHEREIIGTVAYCGEFRRAIALIAEGRVRAADMITARIPLSDLVRVGYRELLENTESHVKILVSPSA